MGLATAAVLLLRPGEQASKRSQRVHGTLVLLAQWYRRCEKYKRASERSQGVCTGYLVLVVGGTMACWVMDRLLDGDLLDSA